MALRLAVTAVNSHTASHTNLCQAAHQIGYQTVALEALSQRSSAGVSAAGNASWSAAMPSFEAVYKHSRFGQLLRPAVPRDLLRSKIEGVRNGGRAISTSRSRVGDSAHRFSLSGRVGPLSLFRIFTPFRGSIILELLPQRLGNKFPSIRFHQLESQLYMSDALLTKHNVVQCKYESQN